jgi:hypothetical protein
VAPPPPGRPPGPVLEPSPSAYAKGKEVIGEPIPELTSLCILTNEPTPLGTMYSCEPPVEKERIVLSDVRTEIGATVDWGFVLKLLLKLLPKLVLTPKDDEAWLDDVVILLERAAELIGVYVAVGSNIFKNEKLRAKILLFYENEVLYSQISVSFWQNITFLNIFATIFKKCIFVSTLNVSLP